MKGNRICRLISLAYDGQAHDRRHKMWLLQPKAWYTYFQQLLDEEL